MVEGKPLQIGTLHYLGTNFSQAYRSNDHVYGLCFGFSERILGALKLIYKDNYKYFQNYYAIIELIKSIDQKNSSHPCVLMRDTLKKTYTRIEKQYDPVYFLKSFEKTSYYKIGSKTYFQTLDQCHRDMQLTRKNLTLRAENQVQRQFRLYKSLAILGTQV